MNLILKAVNKVLNTHFGEEVPDFPSDFCLIDFSPIAKQNGIRTEQNKLIYRYSRDKFGNLIVRKYKYSIHRLNSLIEIYNIPFIDKTKGEDRIPIWAKIMPSEITYHKG